MFCIDYYPFQDYIKEAEEIKISYKNKSRSLLNLIQQNSYRTVIIKIENEFNKIDAQLLSTLNDQYHNIKISFPFANQEALSLAQEYQIPFFFSNFVTSIDQVMGLLNYNPTDMYICEELGFFLDNVSEILHAHNIKIRVFPNICQSSFAETPSLKTFFIRPEDIPFYSLFVDVFELLTTRETQKVIFKAYKNQKWFGQINEIIPSFKMNLDNKSTSLNFGLFRCSCHKKCFYKPNSCNICDRFVELANTLQENNIFIKPRARGEEDGGEGKSAEGGNNSENINDFSEQLQLQ